MKPQTWQAINELVVRKAQQLGVEDGRKVRADCTVVESNIHQARFRTRPLPLARLPVLPGVRASVRTIYEDVG